MSREVELALQRPLFAAPRWSSDGTYDIVVVGVPNDSGSTSGGRSPATGPGFIREASCLFPMRKDRAGASVGWYDYAHARPRLAGLRLADAGDFVCQRGRGMGQFDELPEVYDVLAATTRLLVVLAGDHSTSYWMAKRLHGEALVWLDAHEDARGKTGPYPDHANVVSYIDEAPGVSRIVQYGLRGLVTNARAQVPPNRRIAQTIAGLVAELDGLQPAGLAVSIDIDVLDPAVCPCVTSPQPEGKTYDDLLAVLRALLTAGHQIRVLELAEFAPRGSDEAVHALGVVNFLLRALSICVGEDPVT